MAFTATAALIAGTEAVTATLVLSAVAEVGMALSVVGMVTGSKDLLKVGGVLSLVGGVGGLIAGATSGAAGVLAEGAADAATSAATDAALETASTEAAGAFGGEAAAQAATADTVAGLEGATSGAITTPVTSSGIVGSNLPPLGETAASTASQAGNAMQVAPGASQPAVTDIAMPGAPNAPMGAQAPVGAQAPATPADFEVGGRYGPDNMDVGGGFNPAGNAPQQAGSYFSKLSSFAEKNKTLFSSGMQVVGGMMKGANDRDIMDQRMQMERDRFNRANSVGRFQPRGIVGGAAA